ncbi:hypothetical protein CTA1_6250 [Colletotrichum tanaceti]|uniref:Uncharacterized protein n=1 Tax=Colletotrichum tanaceti TaxID=1306861 RepID=A0A4U6X2D9_9PEZI|nr:hypothetical protein CTA1_6250 [Colletotrichum tanaceti]
MVGPEKVDPPPRQCFQSNPLPSRARNIPKPATPCRCRSLAEGRIPRWPRDYLLKHGMSANALGTELAVRSRLVSQHGSEEQESSWGGEGDSLVINSAQTGLALSLEAGHVEVVLAEGDARGDLGAEEHGLLETILVPLAQVRWQGGELDARGRLAVEVMSGMAAGGGVATSRGAGRALVLGRSSRSGLQKGVYAGGACGSVGRELVRDAREGARGGLRASARRRGQIGGQLRGEHGGRAWGDEVAGQESLENVVLEATQTRAVADEDEVVPARGAHVHVLDALNGAVDGGYDAVDLGAVGEGEALKTNLDVATDALGLQMGRLGSAVGSSDSISRSGDGLGASSIRLRSRSRGCGVRGLGRPNFTVGGRRSGAVYGLGTVRHLHVLGLGQGDGLLLLGLTHGLGLGFLWLRFLGLGRLYLLHDHLFKVERVVGSLRVGQADLLRGFGFLYDLGLPAALLLLFLLLGKKVTRVSTCDDRGNVENTFVGHLLLQLFFDAARKNRSRSGLGECSRLRDKRTGRNAGRVGRRKLHEFGGVGRIRKDLADVALLQLFGHVVSEVLVFELLEQLAREHLSTRDKAFRVGRAELAVVDNATLVYASDIDFLVANIDHGEGGPLEAVLGSNAAVDHAEGGRPGLLEDVARESLDIGAAPLRRRHEHDRGVMVRSCKHAVNMVEKGKESFHVYNATAYVSNQLALRTSREGRDNAIRAKTLDRTFQRVNGALGRVRILNPLILVLLGARTVDGERAIGIGPLALEGVEGSPLVRLGVLEHARRDAVDGRG